MQDAGCRIQVSRFRMQDTNNRFGLATAEALKARRIPAQGEAEPWVRMHNRDEPCRGGTDWQLAAGAYFGEFTESIVEYRITNIESQK
jgi:hypothetical protein